MEQNNDTGMSKNRRFPFLGLLKGINSQSRSMRSKLMLYLFFLVLAGYGLLFLILTATGVFEDGGRGLEQNLQVQLQNQYKDIKERMDLFASNGIDLSRRLKSSLERDILTYPYDIKELENNEEGLKKTQANAYIHLDSKLQVTRASGAFAVFDTTVNTESPIAKDSRSGIYLRMANVSGSALENDIFLFRGNPNIAMENRIQIHNRWNMEFNIKQMDWFETQLFGGTQNNEGYMWIDRHTLEGTWENGIFLSVPIIGSEGAAYGICGLELSSLLFRLSYPSGESKYGDMVTIFAPVEGDKVLVSKGVTGNQGNSYVNENEDLNFSIGKGCNTYTNNQDKYLGIQKNLEGAKDSEDRQWAVVVLLPYSSFNAQVGNERAVRMTILSLFVGAMLLCSYIISRRFVRPIEQGIENLKRDDLYEQQLKSGIKEIDVLAQFLKQKEEKYMNEGKTETGLPPNVEELFNRFIENSKDLTISERNILGYYIKGYEIAEVPALECVSINTIRKHNRSIYKKLGVNSKDELQLYIDLLKRCGKLDELL